MDNEENVGDADAVVRAMAYLGGVPGTRCDIIEMNREREQALRKIWATAEAAIDLVAPPRVMEMRVTADGRLTFHTNSSLEPEVATACPARLKHKVVEYIRNHPVQMSLEYFNDMQTYLKLKPKANKAEEAEQEECDAEDVEHDEPEGDEDGEIEELVEADPDEDDLDAPVVEKNFMMKRSGAKVVRGTVSTRDRRNLKPVPRERSGSSSTSTETLGVTLKDQALRYYRDKCMAGEFKTLDAGDFNLTSMLEGMLCTDHAVMLDPGFAVRAKHGNTRGQQYMTTQFKEYLVELFENGEKNAGHQQSSAQMLASLRARFPAELAFPTEGSIQSFVSALKRKKETDTPQAREKRKRKLSSALEKARNVRRKNNDGKGMNATDYQSVLAYLYRRDGKKGTTAIAAADRLARLEEEYGADWIRQIPMEDDG